MHRGRLFLDKRKKLEYFAERTESSDAFLRDTQYTGVPNDLQHFIFRAITWVPKREVWEREQKKHSQNECQGQLVSRYERGQL